MTSGILDRPRSADRATVIFVLLVVAGLAIACPSPALAKGPDRYRVTTPAGRIIAGELGRADVPVADVEIVAEIAGDPDEATWCQWARVTWPDGTRSGNESDCPPYDEWRESVRAAEECEAAVVVVPAGEEEPDRGCPVPYSPARRWSWRRPFAARSWRVLVEFLDGSRVVRVDYATFTIPGGDEKPW